MHVSPTESEIAMSFPSKNTALQLSDIELKAWQQTARFVFILSIIMMIVGGIAFISGFSMILIGMYADGSEGLMETVGAVIFALGLIICIAGYNGWTMDKEVDDFF